MKKTFIAGDIVLVPFPFSDLSKNKVRPALVLAYDKEDVTVLFITSLKPKGSFFVEVQSDKVNNLKVCSYVRYTKFASLDIKIVLGKIGAVSKKDFSIVGEKIANYLHIL